MATYQLLQNLGIFSVIIAAIVWLLKELSKHWIDKKMKLHELELDQQMERFKSELELLNQKQGKLHDKHLEVIHELYSLFTEFHINLDNLIRWKNITGKSKEEIEKDKLDDVKQTFKSGADFSIFYLKNKLYFTDQTCARIDEILKILKGCQYDLTIEYQWMNISVDLQMTQFKQAKDKLENEVPKLKKELEADFRNILGVEEI